MKTFLTTVLMALGLSTAAMAQELPSFEEVDRNSDGMIDPAESVGVEGLDFATADTNQDGVIDQQEYERLS